VYGLEEPGEFNFGKFSAFCDTITQGAAPFAGIDPKSRGGIIIEDEISFMYKIEHNKIIHKNTLVVEMKS